LFRARITTTLTSKFIFHPIFKTLHNFHP
jgi:hypothetical protein